MNLRPAQNFRMAMVIGLAILPSPALADEISGDWCSPDGTHLRIEADRILSPGGQWTDGVYSRHNYTFMVPDGEEDAGAWVTMRQLSEDRMIYAQDGEEPMEWRRCDLTS